MQFLGVDNSDPNCLYNVYLRRPSVSEAEIVRYPVAKFFDRRFYKSTHATDVNPYLALSAEIRARVTRKMDLYMNEYEKAFWTGKESIELPWTGGVDPAAGRDNTAFCVHSNPNWSSTSMSAKPWDILREAVLAPPIGSGVWKTSGGNAALIEVSKKSGQNRFYMNIGSQSFTAPQLRELAEFCIEAAAQLDRGQ